MSGVEGACVVKVDRSNGCEPSSGAIDIETTERVVSDIVALKRVDYIAKKCTFEK